MCFGLEIRNYFLLGTLNLRLSEYKIAGVFDMAKLKIPVFRVTQPYLHLLVKPRIFFSFPGKNIILCILKGEMPFKMHKIIPEKIIEKNVPTLPKICRRATRNHLLYIRPKPYFAKNSLKESDPFSFCLTNSVDPG